MLGNGHVRFGGRAGETHPVKAGQGAPARPLHTYVRTWSGFCYAGFIIDAYSRLLVGWQLASHLRTDLALDALEMAIWRRQAQLQGLVHHSDRGSQGGFNWSSQHLEHGGVDGTTTGLGCSGDGEAADAVAWAAAGSA
jgi:transposase InsO family protein